MPGRNYTINLSFALFFLVLLCRESAIAGNEKIDCSKPAMLLRMLEKYHYSPVKLNDSVSQQIFDSFFEMADPHLTFFTDVEMKQLLPYRTMLDDEIKNKSCRFLSLVTELYGQQLKTADSLITEIVKQPFDYSAHDTMFFTHERGKDYANDNTHLKKRWSKWLKYQTLNYLVVFTNEEEKPLTSKELLAGEPEVRKKIAQKEKQYIDRVLHDPMGFEYLVNSILCNAIANRFDPHTLFFSPWSNLLLLTV